MHWKLDIDKDSIFQAAEDILPHNDTVDDFDSSTLIDDDLSYNEAEQNDVCQEFHENPVHKAGEENRNQKSYCWYRKRGGYQPSNYFAKTQNCRYF